MKKILAICCAAASLAAQEERCLETLYPAWGQSFEVSRVLYSEKSDFWDLVLFQNPLFGKVLAIDGVIQLTEADEAIYSEMMAHVPLLAHGKATSVLIIGGGDGCILREVLKHPTVDRVVLVEIDRNVIELSRRYLSELSQGAFDDPRVEIAIRDAAQYVQEIQESFDIILCDSTDPVGPARALFSREFYAHCKALLNRGGIFVNQNGVPFLQQEELALTLQNRQGLFEHVGFYCVAVPTYVGGVMVLGWATDVDYSALSEKVLEERLERLKGKMQYYTPAIHKASFSLPAYAIIPFIKNMVLDQ